MSTQSANICETCQFVSQDDQQDHSCLDHLRKVNRQLLIDRTKLSDTEPASDSPDRISDLKGALQYILEAKNTEGDCYEFVGRLKAKADQVLRKWGIVT